MDEVEDASGNRYARKFIPYHSGQRGDRDRAEAKKEVEVMRRFDHDHIVKVAGSYEQQKPPGRGILMQPVADGRSLETFFGSAKKSKARDDVLWGGIGCLAKALAYIHSGRILHEDIKAANVLVHRGQMHFADFGLAKDFKDRSKSATYTANGYTLNVSRHWCYLRRPC